MVEGTPGQQGSEVNNWSPMITPKMRDGLANWSAIATLATTAFGLLFYFINLEIRTARLEAQMQATTITTTVKGDGGKVSPVTVNPVLQTCADLAQRLANARSIDTGYIKSAMDAIACDKMPAAQPH